MSRLFKNRISDSICDLTKSLPYDKRQVLAVSIENALESTSDVQPNSANNTNDDEEQRTDDQQLIQQFDKIILQTIEQLNKYEEKERFISLRLESYRKALKKSAKRIEREEQKLKEEQTRNLSTIRTTTTTTTTSNDSPRDDKDCEQGATSKSKSPSSKTTSCIYQRLQKEERIVQLKQTQQKHEAQLDTILEHQKNILVQMEHSRSKLVELQSKREDVLEKRTECLEFLETSMRLDREAEKRQEAAKLKRDGKTKDFDEEEAMTMTKDGNGTTSVGEDTVDSDVEDEELGKLITEKNSTASQDKE